MRFDFTVLRQLRKNRGMTLEEVAQAAKLSIAVVSKLERNQTVAELETIHKLGRVFDMSASELLKMAESPFAHRASESNDSSEGFHFRRLAYGNAMALFARASKGAALSRPEIHQNDYEICWALKGTVRLSLPFESHELKAGEGLQFDAILEHTYEALADCELLILHLRKVQRF